jgi:hypothetical protein
LKTPRPRVKMPAMSPLILFGAFDRHNLGDLLLGCIAAARVEAHAPARPRLFAGAASRDLRAVGGAQVHGLDALIDHWQRAHADDPQRAPPDLLQVGGEILGCTAWEAAVMLAPQDRAAALIAAHDRDLAGREAWARQHLGITRALPYLASHAQLPAGTRIAHAGSGGVGFARLAAASRRGALADLGAAAVLHVRDRRTQDTLAAAGISALLAPDPAALVARVLGAAVTRHAGAGEPAVVRARFPAGWIAAQVSAEFGDDATLDALAAGLDRLQRDTGLGLVLLCAGRAPWHDEPAVLHRLRTRLHEPTHCIVAVSTHVLDLCALLAGCTLCLASSLHARIVAEAFARPAVSLVQASAQGAKLRAYLETWHADALHLHRLDAAGPLQAAQAALSEPAPARHARAAQLAGLAETAFQRCLDALTRA